MKPVFFIAKKFHSSNTGSLRYSKPIIGIATAGVAVGIIVMMLSIAIANGFKREISDNVAAANTHFKILPIGFKDNSQLWISNSQSKITEIRDVKGVSTVLGSIYQPVLIENQGDLYGIVLKASSQDLPENFAKRFLKEGSLPSPKDSSTSICLSKKIAKRLKLQLGDPLNVYITNQGANIKRRRLKLGGIFETGVPGIDEEMAFSSYDFLIQSNPLIPEIAFRKTTDGSIMASSKLDEPMALYQGNALLGAKEQWVLKPESGIPYTLCIKTHGIYDSISVVFNPEFKILNRWNNHQDFAQVIEIYAKDFSELNALEERLLDKTDYNLQLSSIQEEFPEIFNWLNLLDTNVIVLLLIMAIVSLVNMASALLVLIIEKTKAIALLKTMGAANKLIRKVFLSIAAFILIRGLIIGNILALGFLFLQKTFRLIPLNQEQYYVSFVPVKINWIEVLSVNLGTMLFCLIVLILPTLLIARIYPAKALRIE